MYWTLQPPWIVVIGAWQPTTQGIQSSNSELTARPKSLELTCSLSAQTTSRKRCLPAAAGQARGRVSVDITQRHDWKHVGFNSARKANFGVLSWIWLEDLPATVPIFLITLAQDWILSGTTDFQKAKAGRGWGPEFRITLLIFTSQAEGGWEACPFSQVLEGVPGKNWGACDMKRSTNSTHTSWNQGLQLVPECV